MLLLFEMWIVFLKSLIKLITYRLYDAFREGIHINYIHLKIEIMVKDIGDNQLGSRGVQ